MRVLPFLLLATAVSLGATSAFAQDGAVGSVRVDAAAPAGQLHIVLEGGVAPPMAEALERLVHATPQGRRTILHLDSLGGQVEEGLRIAAFLEEERLRGRPVETVIDPGRRCGSICVALFLAGAKRKASDATLMMFHGVTAGTGTGGAARRSAAETDRLFAWMAQRGLSAAWLEETRRAWGFDRGGERWLSAAEAAQANPNAAIEIVAQKPPAAR